jgi:hypothetical protein
MVVALFSGTTLAVLWIVLGWVGHFAAMAFPARLVTTARYAVWTFAWVAVVTAAAFVILIYQDDAISSAYTAVGIRESEEAPGADNARAAGVPVPAEAIEPLAAPRSPLRPRRARHQTGDFSSWRWSLNGTAPRQGHRGDGGSIQPQPQGR